MEQERFETPGDNQPADQSEVATDQGSQAMEDLVKTYLSADLGTIEEAEGTELVGQGGRKRNETKEKVAHQDPLVVEAVEKVRKARMEGDGDTAIIVAAALRQAVGRSRRRHRIAIILLSLALISVSVFAVLSLNNLKKKKIDIDSNIDRLEAELQTIDDPIRMEAMIKKLDEYQSQARGLRRNMLYQLGDLDEEEDYIGAEIRLLLEEFGADTYSVPPQFIKKVRFFIAQYQNRDRRNIERVLGSSRDELQMVRQILAEANLPPDLAYS